VKALQALNDIQAISILNNRNSEINKCCINNCRRWNGKESGGRSGKWGQSVVLLANGDV
jgi:hypothetical protein